MKLTKVLKTLLFGAAIALALPAGDVLAAANADGSVTINEENFPDAVFRSYVSALDGAEDGVLTASELAAITTLNVSTWNKNSSDIASLQGIEYFTSLQKLDCSANKITELDVSRNTELIEFYCSSNKLTKLDVTNNIKLEKFSCTWNLITELDLSKNTKLKSLDCATNQLKELDVSNCPDLTRLNCTLNLLTKLDISNNTKLTYFDCIYNELLCIDMSKTTTYANLGSQTGILGEVYDDYISLGDYDANIDFSKISNVTGAANFDATTGRFTGYSDGTPITYVYTEVNAKGVEHKMNVTLKFTVAGPRPTPTPAPTLSPEIAEKVKAFTTRMYTVVLGREAEKAGINDWTSRLLSHEIDGAGIAHGFIMSAEFIGKGLSDEAYVDVLYKAFFDREADADGKNNWLTLLSQGRSRGYVLSGFVNSAEFDALCTSYSIVRGTMNEDGIPTASGVRGFVERCYSTVLGRESDAAGLDHWTNLISSGQMSAEDVAKNFFFSAEYTQKNTSDEEFVETLYQTFMNRASDEGGKADWLAKLSGGMSRNEVLEGFSRSAEFAAILKSYGL